jgi:hypothetical protein
MLRQLSALLTIFALLVPPAEAFDTYWHSQCSQSVGEKLACQRRYCAMGLASFEVYGAGTAPSSPVLTINRCDLVNSKSMYGGKLN